MAFEFENFQTLDNHYCYMASTKESQELFNIIICCKSVTNVNKNITDVHVCSVRSSNFKHRSSAFYADLHREFLSFFRKIIRHG